MRIIPRLLVIFGSEAVLLVVGSMTYPAWVEENFAALLALSTFILLLGVTWDHWPRLIQWNKSLWWADLDVAAKMLRDEADRFGDKQLAEILDASPDRHDQPGIVVMASAYIAQGINKGYIDARGVPENGLDERHIPTPVSSNINDAYTMWGGDRRLYANVRVKRSGIREYVDWLRRP